MGNDLKATTKTFDDLYKMGFDEKKSWIAAQKFPKNIEKAIVYIENDLNVVEQKQPPENNDNAILKQGQLSLKGSGFTGSWKAHYFILRANGDFSYYKDPNDQSNATRIDLRKVYKVERNKKYLYLHTNEGRCDLWTDSEYQLDEWEPYLQTVCTKDDYAEFKIEGTECEPVICNNQVYGFIGQGLPFQLASKIRIFSEITFCSFIYPKENQTVPINSNTITLDLDGNVKFFSLEETHHYTRKIEKNSFGLTENTVLSGALMQKKTDVAQHLGNLADGEIGNEEIKCNYNANDIFINIDLQCNFAMTAEHTIALTGEIKKGLFGKSDNRKLSGEVKIFLSAYVKATFDVLSKNDSNTRDQWWMYRNRLMDEAFEKRRRQMEERCDELVLAGEGNRICLLPRYMQQKLPMKEYELKPIWNRILNKRFLCHEEPVMINMVGEKMNKKIYVMAELQFVREQTYEDERYCDTVYVNARGRIVGKKEHSKYRITDIILFDGYYGQNIQYGTFHGVINNKGKDIISGTYMLDLDDRVKVAISAVQSDDEYSKKVAAIKIYAKNREQRYYYSINSYVSYTNEVVEQLPANYPKDDCVIL